MIPGTYDLKLYRGDSWSVELVLWQDADKTIPADLTGVTVKSEIRDKPSGTTIVEITTGLNLPNRITLSLTAAQAKSLPHKGAWDCQLTYASSGVVATILAGKVEVTPDVTDSTASTTTFTAPRAVA